eukprot:500158_1
MLWYSVFYGIHRLHYQLVRSLIKMIRACSIILLACGIVYPRNGLCASVPRPGFEQEQINIASGFVRGNGYRSNSPNYVNDDLVGMIATFASGPLVEDADNYDLRGVYELDVKDTKDDKWYPAKIAKVQNYYGAGEVTIHFLGRRSKDDEHIEFGSDRLASRGRYETDWDTGIFTPAWGFWTKRMPNGDIEIILDNDAIYDDNGSVTINLSDKDVDMDYYYVPEPLHCKTITDIEWSRDNSDENHLYTITKADLDENKWVKVQVEFVGQKNLSDFTESTLLPI